MRMRRKKNLFPRLERCADITVKEPEKLKGRWRELLGRESLFVELGCGKGAFTARTAAEDPEAGFVAVERVADAIVVAMERAKAAELSNVRFVWADVKKLGDIFAPGEADGIYINFCDPWPSRKNAHKRLTAPGFLMSYREVLKKDGRIFFKTDNQELFTYSLKSFGQCGFECVSVTRDLHASGTCGIMTDYEEKFSAQGVPICRCEAVMRELPEEETGEEAPREEEK